MISPTAKEERNAYYKSYYKRNKEAISKRAKERYQEQKELRKIKQEQYWEERARRKVESMVKEGREINE